MVLASTILLGVMTGLSAAGLAISGANAGISAENQKKAQRDQEIAAGAPNAPGVDAGGGAAGGVGTGPKKKGMVV